MEDNNSIMYEKVYFMYALENASLYCSIVDKSFFQNQAIGRIYYVCQQYYERFKTVPNQNTIMLICSKYNEVKEDKVNISLIPHIFEVPLSDYDPAWVEQYFTNWLKFNKFQKSLVDMVTYVKTTDIKSDNLNDVMQKAVNILLEGRVEVGTSSEEYGSDLLDYKSHVVNEGTKIRTNKNFINTVLGGGYDPKTLIVYIGEQGKGKSNFMCNDAADFVAAGKNVLYISAEMSEQKTLKRIGSKLFRVPIRDYEKTMSNPEIAKKIISGFTSTHPKKLGKLVVRQLADPSVIDIENTTTKIEAKLGISFDVVFVDYLNILSNWRNRNTENTYINGKQISKDLRDFAIRKNKVVISGSQVGKSAWNSTDITIADIAESAGVAHNADLILGIIQDDEMFTNNEFWLKILKIRDGEGRNSRVKMQVNYTYMEIIETTDTDLNGFRL